jgi:hypothetical protein
MRREGVKAPDITLKARTALEDLLYEL